MVYGGLVKKQGWGRGVEGVMGFTGSIAGWRGGEGRERGAI